MYNSHITAPPHSHHSMLSAFGIHGRLRHIAPFVAGHINKTYVSEFDHKGSVVRYLHQRVNRHVFHDVSGLMENIERVTTHLHTRLAAAGVPDAHRRALTIIPTRDGRPWWEDEKGEYWRTFLFIEGTQSLDVIDNVHQARAVARAFGEFQNALADLPGGPLRETIPDFHNTPLRRDALQTAAREDRQGRAQEVRAEVDFALARHDFCRCLLDARDAGQMPLRTTHNDTKVNNVLLDRTTGEGVCVVDLDTCMPGLALYDFGDLVRSATNSTAEDEPETALVRFRTDIFEALTEGYLTATRSMLAPSEIAHLHLAGRVIALELGMRFLTDHLNGDMYSQIHRPGQNLDRCRTQFALVDQMEQQEPLLAELVQSKWNASC